MGVLWGWTSNKPFWQWPETGISSKAGVRISNENALTVTAYYAGVTLISQTLAQVPLPLYKRLPRGKERAIDHPLYSVLHNEPNPYMSAFAFKEALQGHILTWGNAFAEIEWEGDYVANLWPLRPDSMQIAWDKGKLLYIYTVPGGEKVSLTPDTVLHIPGFGFDGVIGYDPITLAREALGLSKATEEFGAHFFANGASLSGVITHPGKLSEIAEERMRKSWADIHHGLSNQHRVAILQEGVKFDSIGVNPENAQFLETRRFQVAEIARFLHIPPHLIGDVERSTSWGTGIEQQNIGFLQYTMMPWFARWEQNINRKCLSMADKQTYFSEFMPASLLRGDLQSRYSAYSTGRQWGWLSANDIREKENENPIPGGDDYYMPLNMLTTGQIAEDATKGLLADIRDADVVYSDDPFYKTQALVTKSQKRGAAARQQTAKRMSILFYRAGKTIVDAEIKAIKEHLNQKAEFSTWLETFYAAFTTFIIKTISGPVKEYIDAIMPLAAAEVQASDTMPDMNAFIKKYAEIFARDYVYSSKGQLKQIADENTDIEEAVTSRLTEWEEKRPGKIEMNESVACGNAIAKTVFVAAGIIKLMWVASGDSCPFCTELNGQIVGTEGKFGVSGLSPASHPPIHEGCQCQVVPTR